MANLIYDVFLSHASRDKLAVEEIANRLKRRRLKPFLDKWHLVPGEPWQEALEDALDQSRTFAVFLGLGDLGPWQNEEMRDALATRVRDKSRRVIPVLLPGASIPNESALPRFLKRLTWVDFRSGLNDRDALHRLVCGIKGIPPNVVPVPTPPVSRTIMIGVPHRNPYFTGRESLLARIHQQLWTYGISALAQAAIHGLGGIGKTQTAIEYAHHFEKHYGHVLWVVAESEPAIRAAYLSIARELGLSESQADIETAVVAVKTWLSRQDNWLLVFDNADDPAVVRVYLPSARAGGKILLTSRAKSFSEVGLREPFRVETLEPEDAVKFLVNRTGNADFVAAANLAAELGYLPLALEQAAAYLETVGGSFSEYLTRYRRQGVALLAKGKVSTDYTKTVATTWMLNFDAVRNTSPASAELLIGAAFLVPDSVPIEIFTLGGSELGATLAQEMKDATDDPLAFWELLEHLERHSLVERLPSDAFKLHRLTQEVIKNWLSTEDVRVWAERVTRALNVTYPEVEFESWSLCERLQPHVHRASELIRAYEIESAAAGDLFLKAGTFAWARGDHVSASHFDEISLDVYERTLGGEHLQTLKARSNLAVIVRSLGDLAEARKLQEQTLEIYERVLNGEHPDTLLARNNLAVTLDALGELADAYKLHEQNLRIRERVLGREHLDPLLSRNNLAATLQDLGDIARAKQLYEQTLEIQERVFGDEHPDTLQVRNNLAEVLRVFDDLPGCLNLHKKNLTLREQVLGREHPDTLMSKNNLAATLLALGDLAGARVLYEQTLEVHERLLGSEHPDTLRVRNNLAEALRSLGDLAGCNKLHRQNLVIRERRLGNEHPVTTTSTWNLLHSALQLDDTVTAAELIDKLRWLLDRDEHEIASAVQRKVRGYLRDFLNRG